MKVYVYAEALSPDGDALRIEKTKVFTQMADAMDYLNNAIDHYLANNVNDWDWQIAQRGDSYAVLFDLAYNYAVSMAVREHEI